MSGLKYHHNPASLFSWEETEAPDWGAMMLHETGSPEKVSKGSWEYPDLVSVVEWMSEQQSGSLEDLGLDPGSSTLCLSCCYL